MKPVGYYRNELYDFVVKNSFFRGKKDIGMTFNTEFNPIKLETIAYITTLVSTSTFYLTCRLVHRRQIHFLISQYIDPPKGQLKRTDNFTISQNRKTYDYYLKALIAWRDKSSASQKTVADLQQRLYNVG